MSSAEEPIVWGSVQGIFDQMLAKIPSVMRSIAHKKVGQKIEQLVRKDQRLIVTEKDLVDAFFAATPFGFHGPMKNDMDEFGINYKQYGY